MVQNTSRYPVQIIVVRDDKDNPATRNEVIANVAKASVAVLHKHSGPEWTDWLSGNYTKSVRRANPKDFQKILDLGLDSEIIADHVVAFTPMHYADLPKLLMRTQVSGLVTVDGDGDYYEPVKHAKHRGEADFADLDTLMLSHGPVQATPIVLNTGLKMSTGKAAAQTAHALMMFWLNAPLAYREEYARKGYPVHIIHAKREAFAEALKKAKHTVVDSGLTEIPAGSTTAVVL